MHLFWSVKNLILNVFIKIFFMLLKASGFSKSVLSFFELLGDDENALSKAFAYFISVNRLAYFKFIHYLGLKYKTSKNHFKQVEVSIQKKRKEGVTDIELFLEKEYHVIVECKIKKNYVTKQRTQYLNAFNEGVKNKVMCFLTSERDTNMLIQDKVNVVYISWFDVLNLFDDKEIEKHELYFKFQSFVNRRYYMKQIKEILVQDLGDKKEIEKFCKNNIYSRDKTRGSPLYFAPYFTAKSGLKQGINYVSKIFGILTLKPTELKYFKEDLTKFTKDEKLIKKWVEGVKKDKSTNEKKTYYFLEDPFEFKTPLLKEKDGKQSKDWISRMIPKNRAVSFIDLLKHVSELKGEKTKQCLDF